MTAGQLPEADLIVVTKCSEDLSQEERQAITVEIAPLEHQRVFFSAIQYGRPYHITNRKTGQVNDKVEVLLVTGIANPAPLKKWLNEESCHLL